jgi:tRNA G46 methylase TrmB
MLGRFLYHESVLFSTKGPVSTVLSTTPTLASQSKPFYNRNDCILVKHVVSRQQEREQIMSEHEQATINQAAEAAAKVPDWTEEELSLMGAETPVAFPLAPPPDDACEAMHKHWERADLARFLLRWEDGYVPDVPEALWDFSWRACDVGSGFGLWCVQQSEQHPKRGYLAIDKGKRRGGRIARTFPELERPNLFALHGDAIPLLASMPDESFDMMTFFYPNPWWPKKHRQKRWAYHPLLTKVIDLLKPGGQVMLCSNEAFTLSEWRYALSHHPAAKGIMQEAYCGPIRTEMGRSHFETKYLAASIPCGEIVFQKG